MRKATHPLLLALALTWYGDPALAQVLLLETDFGGEITEEDRGFFLDALETSAEQAIPGEVLTVEDTASLLGDDLLGCTGGECAVEIGQTIVGMVALRAEVYGEAEIFDFTVRVFDLNTGDTLVTQTGDCTFCPVAEAVEAFGFTAMAAITGIDPMPAASSGPHTEPEPSDPVVEIEQASEEEPTPAYLEGPIQFNISALPETASVFVNDAPAGEGARARLSLAAQDLVIRVEAEGYDEYVEEVTLRDSMGGPIFLRIALAPTAVVVEAEALAQPREPRSEPQFNRLAVGGILAGSGAIMATGGAVLLALDGAKTCSEGPTELCEEVWNFTAGGISLAAIGGVSIGAGAVLLIEAVLDRRGNTEEALQARRPHWALTPTRRGASLVVGREF